MIKQNTQVGIETEHEDDTYKGFEIKCRVCGSLDCVIEEQIDYDYDEVPCTGGFYISCDNCGQRTY